MSNIGGWLTLILGAGLAVLLGVFWSKTKKAEKTAKMAVSNEAKAKAEKEIVINASASSQMASNALKANDEAVKRETERLKGKTGGISNDDNNKQTDDAVSKDTGILTVPSTSEITPELKDAVSSLLFGVIEAMGAKKRDPSPMDGDLGTATTMAGKTATTSVPGSETIKAPEHTPEPPETASATVTVSI